MRSLYLNLVDRKGRKGLCDGHSVACGHGVAGKYFCLHLIIYFILYII